MEWKRQHLDIVGEFWEESVFQNLLYLGKAEEELVLLADGQSIFKDQIVTVLYFFCCKSRRASSNKVDARVLTKTRNHSLNEYRIRIATICYEIG